jgi:nitrite reductase/ring-hydroxylating ferredoxin subunit/DMSO/TMAO reductase YedYZ heme-binding membrane subunit
VSVRYQAVLWNRQKRIYDAVLAAGVAAYLAAFVGVARALHPHATAETLVIRAFGTAAFVLLHVILSIGPLARLDARFLPLLYNRRHLGVTMFLLAAAHAAASIVQFHSLGNVHPLVSVLTSNPRFDSVSQFPFQQLGLAALVVLFLMAATSHDFWLANLTAPVWKSLHMMVYAAWALLVLHVATGALQAERGPLPAALVGAGVVWVAGLHLLAALRERRADRAAAGARGETWVDIGAAADIPENRARGVVVAGERIAVFRWDGRIAAVSGVCQHQNGPLAEGRIVDGLIVCPWHGYQYLPSCGRSPEPFTERIPTFRTRVVDGRVLVDPRPLPPGTDVPPALLEGAKA